MGVVAEVRDAISWLDGVAGKRRGQAGAAVGHFEVSETLLAADDAGFAAKQVSRTFETAQGCERDIHGH